MFGYILAVVIGLVLLGLLISGMTRARPDAGREERPLQSDRPAAEEATPDRSATASRTQISHARRVTPPA